MRFSVIVATLLVVLGSACRASDPAERHTITIRIEADSPNFITETSSDQLDQLLANNRLDGRCIGVSSPSEGDQVVVDDEANKTLSSSRLTLEGMMYEGRPFARAWCVWSASARVPAAEFYKLSLEGHGTKTYSRQDLESADWEVTLQV